MTNKNLLRASLLENGMSDEDAAKLLSISRQSFSYKLNSKRKFTSDEISLLAHELKLSPDRVMKIFFAQKVDETETNGEELDHDGKDF